MRGRHLLRRARRALRQQVASLEIRWAHVHARVVGGPQPDLSIGELPRIALVKQDVFQDLYCCPAGASGAEVVFSSLKRTGPAALFTSLPADFWIVETEPDPECSIWQEKWYDCRQRPLEFYRSLQTRPFGDGAHGHTRAQGEFSVSVLDVDWSRYDIVISLDVAVPERVTREFPGTVWCYFVSEPCMGSYRRSRRTPIAGYDLFLNQRFRRLRVLPSLPFHEVEFPYTLQYTGCLEELCDVEPDSGSRQGIFLESHTASLLSDGDLARLESFGPVGVATGRTEDIVRGLIASKYFVRSGGRIVWGNGMVEAIAAGNLALGNPMEYRHHSLFTPLTCASSLGQVFERLAMFEADPEIYRRERARQRALVDHLCFVRPLTDLYAKSRIVRERRAT